MGDNRYHDLLGLAEGLESPTYYELLKIAPAEVNGEVVEKSYKEQMTKLQHNKSPKHKGFIEFLKDELRNAKLTLTNDGRRKEYDASLNSKHLDAFKERVAPLLEMGELSKKVFETLVHAGVAKHGLTEVSAKELVESLAKAGGCKIQMEEVPLPHEIPPPPPLIPPPPPPPPPAPVGSEPAAAPANSYYGGTADHAPRMSRFGAETPAPPGAYGSGRETPLPPPSAPPESGLASRIQRRSFYDHTDNYSPPAKESERLRRSPSESDFNRHRNRDTPAPRSPSDSDWQKARKETPPRSPSDSDWAKHRPGSPDESGRRRLGSQPTPSEPAPTPPWFQKEPPPAPAPASAASARKPSADEARVVDETRKVYNGGIKLAKLAVAAHDALASYFPRSSDPIARINGVSYEECFKTENKMLKEALPQFKKVVERATPLPGTFAGDLRARAEGHVRIVEAYLKEWKDLKFKLEFQGASKSEMNRLWFDYSRARRDPALKQEIEKPSEYA